MFKTFKKNYLLFGLSFSIALLGFIAYFRVLDAPLVLDDFVIISASKLQNISKYLALSFRSVANLSFALNYQMTGMNLVAFRITNILLHFLSAALVFYLTYLTMTLPSLRDKYKKLEDRKIPLYIALFIATLFLLHPIQTSSVNYITQRMAIMAAMFSFMGIILYVRGALIKERKSIYFYIISFLFFILALFSKENAIMVIPVLMIYDWIFLSSFRWIEFRKRFIPITVFILIFVASAFYYLNAGELIGKVITLFLTPFQPMERYGWSGMGMDWTPMEFILTELRVVSRYIFLIFVPLPSYMVFDYSNAYPVSKGLFDPITTFLSLVTLFSILLFSFRYLKKVPLISFGILWYLITISLESFLALGIDPYFEHRNYLPSYGIFLAIASIFLYTDKFKVRTKIRAEFVIVLVALMLFGLTFSRNNVWRQESSLWEDTIAKSPNNARAYVYLGNAYQRMGLLDKAIETYERSIILKPNFADAYYNLGVVFMNKGMIDKAISEFLIALKINPEMAEAHFSLGMAYGKKDLIDESIEHLLSAVKLRPLFADAHYNLAVGYQKLGAIDKAIEHLKSALQANPNHERARFGLAMFSKKEPQDQSIAHYQESLKLDPKNENAQKNLGNYFYKKGQVDKAVDHYQASLKLKPGDAEVYANLGNIFFRKGKFDLAIEHYQSALRFKPDFLNVRYNLGVALFAKGLFDKAIEQYQIVIKADPTHAEAHENLGVAYASKGLIDKAIEHFTIALKLNPHNSTFRANLNKAYEKKKQK